MQQIAKIIGTNGNIALIEASRSTVCEGCTSTDCGGACKAAALFSNGKPMKTRAKNAAGAEPGDLVEVESSSLSVVLGALVVFVFPIVAAIGAYFFGSFLFSDKTASLISAGVGFVLSWVVVLLIERAVRKRGPSLEVTRIIRRADEAQEKSAGKDGQSENET